MPNQRIRQFTVVFVNLLLDMLFFTMLGFLLLSALKMSITKLAGPLPPGAEVHGVVNQFRYGILEAHKMSVGLSSFFAGVLIRQMWILVQRTRTKKRGATKVYFPLVVTALGVGLCYYLHTQGGTLPPQEKISGFFNITALRFKLFNEGPVPYFILGTFFFGLGCVWHIWSKKYRPVAISLKDLEKPSSDDDQVGYYEERLTKLRDRFNIDQDLSAVIALKDDILQIDEEDFALSFVAVTWAEWALPMLGFLGTVIGIGDALGGIQGAVQTLFKGTSQAANLNEEVLTKFNAGFANMAVAFDTTFLGLMGLLILGMAHTMLKRRIADKLAYARQCFSDEVAKFSAEEDPVIAAVGGLQVATLAGFGALADAVSSSEERASGFRESAKATIERVILEDDRFLSVRNVLFKPCVEFHEVGNEVMNRVREGVTKAIKSEQWTFLSLAKLTCMSSGAAVAVRTTSNNAATDKIFIFSVGGKTGPSLIDTGARLQRLLAVTASHLFLGTNEQNSFVTGGTGKKPATFPGTVKADEGAFPVMLNKKELVILVRRQGHAADLFTLNLAELNEPDLLCRLPEGFEWTSVCVHSPSATLLALGKPNTGTVWRLLAVCLREQHDISSVRDEHDKDTVEKALTTHTEHIDLPIGLHPKQAVPLAGNAVVITDLIGNLFYWDFSRVSLLSLAHNSWTPEADTTLWTGENGWLAIAKKKHLTMWRVRRGGYLYPYEQNLQGFNIGALQNRDQLLVSSDGRYIVAIAGEKSLIAWEFPQYTLDNF